MWKYHLRREGKAHAGLYRSALWIDQEDIHWIRKDLIPQKPMVVQARIRYRQPLAKQPYIQQPRLVFGL